MLRAAGARRLTVDVITVGFAVTSRSCRAILGGFLLFAMLFS